MKAAFLAVGSELLGTDRLDTNSLFVADHLERFGVFLVEKGVVGDDEEAVASAVRRLAAQCDLVVVSGGLGPTADDVTREGVALAFERSLRVDDSIVETIRERFAARGSEMPETNRCQAEMIEGAVPIANSEGTAPGQMLEVDGSLVVLLPGVPVELHVMVQSALVPWLRKHSTEDPLITRSVTLACEHESALEEELASIYDEFGRDGLSTLAGRGDIRIQVKRTDPATVIDRVSELFGDRIFGGDGETLESAVGSLLCRRGAHLAVAESCTGGLLGERLTRVPGSSQYFVGGVIAYSNEEKTRWLDVPRDLVERDGAVSESVALAMARGVRRRWLDDVPGRDETNLGETRPGETWGIGITGIAGPGGATPDKPVGTVFVAIDGPSVEVRRLALLGDRQKIRWMSSHWALELLRRLLLEESRG